MVPPPDSLLLLLFSFTNSFMGLECSVLWGRLLRLRKLRKLTRLRKIRKLTRFTRPLLKVINAVRKEGLCRVAAMHN